jgi:tetratricopeptide (TPR) repeat protein
VDEKRTDSKAELREPVKETSEDIGPHCELDLIIYYRQGELTPVEHEAVKEHLTRCAQCTRLLLELRDFEAVSASEDPEAASLRQEVMRSLIQSLPSFDRQEATPLGPATDEENRPHLANIQKQGEKEPDRIHERPNEREAARGRAARGGMFRKRVPQVQTRYSTIAQLHLYDKAFDQAQRAAEAFLTQFPEVQNPELLLVQLKKLPKDLQVKEVRASLRFHNPRIVERLLDLSHNSRFDDREEMLHWATLAVTCARLCTVEAVGGSKALLDDLLARAWGDYGNALLVSGRLEEAEKAFTTAEGYREAGTGDPMLHAALLGKNSSLAVSQGRFEEAIEMCEEASEIYREIGERHLLARTMVLKARATFVSGEVEDAAEILDRAILLIDREEDPHLLVAACHNLVLCYLDLRRPMQAEEIFSAMRELYEKLDNPLILLQATWLEGQIRLDLGQLKAAETALLRARKGYIERKLAYEVALISLDLAAVYVKLGLVDKLEETMLETVPNFHALRVELETFALLLQLQQVADQEQQALEIIGKLTAHINRSRQ